MLGPPTAAAASWCHGWPLLLVASNASVRMVSALTEYKETDVGIREIMRECHIGWPSSDEDAASLDAHDDDLSTIKKHDNKLTRHPATSLLVQHAAIMAAFVEWWHVRLRAGLVYGLPALAIRSAPLPP